MEPSDIKGGDQGGKPSGLDHSFMVGGWRRMDGKTRRRNADIPAWARFLEIPSLQQCLIPQLPGETKPGVNQNHKLFLRKED